MPITDEDYFEKIKKIDVLADELETEITASMQTCLIRFGEIVQIQNAMIQKMHALSDEIFQLRGSPQGPPLPHPPQRRGLPRGRTRAAQYTEIQVFVS